MGRKDLKMLHPRQSDQIKRAPLSFVSAALSRSHAPTGAHRNTAPRPALQMGRFMEKVAAVSRVFVRRSPLYFIVGKHNAPVVRTWT